MNIIEKYADNLSHLRIDMSLFSKDVLEMCPKEGVQNFEHFQKSLEAWFPKLEKIVVTNIVTKNVNINNEEQLHGVLYLEVYYKVHSGKAKVDALHVVQAHENGKIFLVNSFWKYSQFEQLVKNHPELGGKAE